MNLVKVALAAQRFAQTQHTISVDPLRCVRVRDKSIPCAICAELCPATAIHLENGVEVDTEACIRCGVCLHACPTGAFEGNDGVDKLLRCVDQLVDRETVEIACALHPDPASGDPHADAVLRTTGCLAALGASAYLSLATHDVRHIRVRLDTCEQCPLAMLQPQIEASLREADRWFQMAGGKYTVAKTEPIKRSKQRPVYSVNNPPMSRRGLFRAFAPNSIQDSVDTDTPNQTDPVDNAPHERQRLIAALRALIPGDSEQSAPDGFAAFSVSDACTACGLCARICPTGALEMRMNEERFQLGFASSACVNCALCLKYCDAEALDDAGSPTVTDLLRKTHRVLHEGSLKRCRKCHVPFAGQAEDDLCPACAFRAKNPFGAMPKRRTVTTV